MLYIDFFTSYELSTHVAEVRVTSVPARAGAVGLEVLRTLKGPDAVNLVGRVDGVCPPTLSRGQRVIAFFDADLRQVAIELAPRTIAPALRMWRAAHTDVARRRVLDRLARSKREDVATAARERIHREDKLRDLVRDGAAPWDAPGTSAAAIARVVARWPTIGGATGAKLAYLQRALPDKRALFNASLRSCARAAAEVRDTIGTAAVGSLAALASERGDCWLTIIGIGSDEAFAYLRATDGALVMLWLPER